MGMELLYKHTLAQQQEQIETQKDEINDLRAQMSQMTAMMQQVMLREKKTPAVQEVAISAGDHSEIKVDNRRIHTQHITINVFGQERLDHITQAQIHRILTGVQAFSLPNAGTQAVLQAAMLAYSDPEHPENLTCYLPNKKLGDALVHGGTGWEIHPVQLVLPPMMQRSVDLLFEKQPREGLERDDLEACGTILKELETCEQDPSKVRQLAGPDGALKAVLIRNKDQLARILEKLPVAGQK